MKLKLFKVVVALLFTQFTPAFAATTNVYSTQFENTQGYTGALELIGQAGWTGEGTGGNGIVTNYIAGQGQQAYIGSSAPDPADDILYIWKPIDFNPVAAGYPIVKFSTQMQIVDSTNGKWDIFRWSIYNIQGDRLFSINFDNLDFSISYLLDGTNNAVLSTNEFENAITYTLTVTMNFASNRWSASLNNALIATNRLITTTNAPLNLGDVDAIWLVNQITYTNGLGQIITTNAPGNNYMLFDNYVITAESIPVPPAQIQLSARTAEGWTVLQVNGQNGSRWSVDATTNLVNWTALKTNIISGGFFNHLDNTSGGLPRRYYRARLVP